MDTSKAANDGRLKSGQRKAAGTGVHGSGDSRVSMTVGLLSVFPSVGAGFVKSSPVLGGARGG